MVAHHRLGHALHLGHQMRITRQVRDAELQLARLPGTQHFTGAPQFQILLRNAEPIVGFTHHDQALLRQPRQRRLIQQHA